MKYPKTNTLPNARNIQIKEHVILVLSFSQLLLRALLCEIVPKSRKKLPICKYHKSLMQNLPPVLHRISPI